jgi:hypothetical protein
MTKKQKCLIPALLLGALILGGCGQTTNSSSNTSSSDAPSSSSSSSKGGSSSSSTSATVTSIAVVEGLNASYQQNVSVDLANVVVKATYSDATSKNVKQADGVTFSVSKVDTSVVGENFSFTISFGGKSVVWTYAVIAQATPSNVLIKSGLATSYSLNDVVDISAITATVTYSDGSSKDVNQGTGLTFSVTSIDTSTLGTFQFTYSFEKVSGNWEYTVNSWTIATFDNPDFVSKWEAAKSATGDYGYSRTTDAFTVGNINAFKFLPEMTAVDPKTKKPVSISAYHSNSTLEILGSDGTTYTVLDAQTLGTYCSINEFTSTYQFTASAIGHSFRLTVKPVTDASEDFSLTFNFAVADGYNVYSAKDLAVLAQRGFDARFVDATSTMTAEQVKAKMWLDFRTQKGIPELPKLAGVYFMNDIKLNHDDFPADCFWTAESLTNFSDFKNSGMDFSKFVFYKHVSSEGVITYTTENNGGDKLSLIGSIKDGNIITWQNAESHSFTMMGNYFSLDATTDSSFRMIIDSEHDGNDRLNALLSDGITADTAAISHAGLFATMEDSATDDALIKAAGVDRLSYFANNHTNKPTYHDAIKDLSAKGNASLSEDPSYMGGLVFYKSEGYTQMDVDNVIANGWYQTLILSYFDYKYVSNCKFYDDFNSTIFSWGGKVYVSNSVLRQAGGPCLIGTYVDYGQSSAAQRFDDKGNCYGFYAQMTVTGSKVNSLLAGTEAWFKINHATAYVAGLKQLSQLIAAADDSDHVIFNSASNFNAVGVLINAYDNIMAPMVGCTMTIDSTIGLDFNGTLIQTLKAGGASSAPAFQDNLGNAAIYNPNASSTQLYNPLTASLVPYFAVSGSSFFKGQYLNLYYPDPTSTGGYLGIMVNLIAQAA